MTVITLPQAEHDIYLSAQWWAEHHSQEQAQLWFDGIWSMIRALDDRPQQWPLARENDAFPYEIRERHFGVSSRPTHRIIFAIRDETVFVLAVYHGAHDVLTPLDVPNFP
jgi:hypothetical protein